MIGFASFLISIPAILLLWISFDSSRPCEVDEGVRVCEGVRV